MMSVYKRKFGDLASTNISGTYKSKESDDHERIIDKFEHEDFYENDNLTDSSNSEEEDKQSEYDSDTETKIPEQRETNNDPCNFSDNLYSNAPPEIKQTNKRKRRSSSNVSVEASETTSDNAPFTSTSGGESNSEDSNESSDCDDQNSIDTYNSNTNQLNYETASPEIKALIDAAFAVQTFEQDNEKELISQFKEAFWKPENNHNVLANLLPRLAKNTLNWGKSNLCWLWGDAKDAENRTTTEDAYGQISLNNTVLRVHQVSYCYLKTQDFPSEEKYHRDENGIWNIRDFKIHLAQKHLTVCHSAQCKKNCLNPSHLTHLATKSDGTAENSEQKRVAIGEQHSTAKLTNAHCAAIGKAYKEWLKTSNTLTIQQRNVSRQQLARNLCAELNLRISSTDLISKVFSGRSYSGVTGIPAKGRIQCRIEQLHKALIDSTFVASLIHRMKDMAAESLLYTQSLIEAGNLPVGTTCWISKIKPASVGYCVWQFHGFKEYMHRYAWYAVHPGSVVPNGFCVMHSASCAKSDASQPQQKYSRRCWNPTHLSIGTARDNAIDKIRDGTSKRKLNPNIYEQIMKMYHIDNRSSPFIVNFLQREHQITMHDARIRKTVRGKNYTAEYNKFFNSHPSLKPRVKDSKPRQGQLRPL